MNADPAKSSSPSFFRWGRACVASCFDLTPSERRLVLGVLFLLILGLVVRHGWRAQRADSAPQTPPAAFHP